MTRICLINAHPDPAPERFCHALADACQAGAESAGHTVSRFDAGAIDYGFLTRAHDFSTPAPDAVRAVQDALSASDHLVLIYPLWLGTMPARTKALLEQLGRENFFLDTGSDSSQWPARKMRGKSARVIVTMGMPEFAYRLFFRSHSLKALETGILGLAGFSPVRSTVFGMVEGSAERRARMLEDARKLGAQAR
ncbi:MAG: NAD(P)H-dependent oxidoreductase [Oceanicaulis sp.]|nr:NAD(P)H-dependent oxidoreductase [Oceanicaulis sp.]